MTARPPHYTAPADMKIHTLLILAVAVGSRAASVPNHALPDLEKKLSDVITEVLKEEKPVENHSSEQELIQPANTVPDVENNLRNVPVKVVISEIKPVLKYGIEKGSNDVIPEDVNGVKREEVDLKNPGVPQRQEHDSQSPEDINKEQQTVQSIKDSKQGIPNPFEQLGPSVQAFIANFTSQITQFNNTFQSLFGQGSNPFQTFLGGSQVNDPVNFEPVNTAKTDINALKQNTEGFNPITFFQQYLSTFTTNFQSTISNFTSQFSNITSQLQSGASNIPGVGAATGILGGSSGGTQSDEEQGNRPGILQAFQNIWNRPGQGQTPNQQGGQADQPAPAAPNGPIAQAIQGVVNFIQRPQATNKPPTQAAADKPAEPSSQEGSNIVPDTDKPATSESKPEAAQKEPEAPGKPGVSGGPIQQIVQRNPVVQGIAGAVQRIQSSIGNPEKPREVEKGGLGYYGGHGGGGTASRNNNNVDSSDVAAELTPANCQHKLPAGENNSSQVKEEIKPDVTKTE